MNNFYTDHTTHELIRFSFVWGTADGRKLRLCDMGDAHIINCIFHVAANHHEYPKSTLKTFVDEANFRGLAWSGPIKPKIQQIKEKVNGGALDTLSLTDLQNILDRLS